MLTGLRCRLRRYALSDAEALARIADDFRVSRWMTAQFPHPYSLADAQAFIALAAAEIPVDKFAVDVDGELAGGAGLQVRGGEQRGVAECGYWLAQRFWGRGIASEAAALLVSHAFTQRHLRRLEAHVFAGNVASMRVLEKAGFVREALLREAYVERDGTVVDGLLYARLRDDREAHRT
jgi:RimJ/RimL family protein N-acetyltransferase